MLSTLLTPILLALFDSAQSLPTPDPQFTVYTCSEITGYKNLVSSPSYQGSWQMTNSPSVVSDEESPASLSAAYSTAVTITITEGFSIGLNLPDDIGEIGFDSSVSWSTTTTNGWSATIPCPAGAPNAYTCGMSAIPWRIDISGVQYKYYSSGGSSNCLNPGAEVSGSEVPFKFSTPELLSDVGAPDKKPHANMIYSACICSVSANQTAQSGLGPCPAPGCG